MQNQLLINGELTTGEGEKQPVYNPATGEVLLEIAEASVGQVDAAVLAADRAFGVQGTRSFAGARHSQNRWRERGRFSLSARPDSRRRPARRWPG